MNENGIVHLWDLPIQSICVKLDSHIQKQMIKEAVRISGNRHKLSDVTGINRTSLIDFEKSRFKSVKLETVIKISDYLTKNGHFDYSLEKLETYVCLLKAMLAENKIINPKLPLNFNTKEGAQIISAFLFDGGITKNLIPFYVNNDEALVSKLLRNIEKTIGEIDYNRKFDDRNRRNKTIKIEFPKILGYILVKGLGMIPGKKVLTNAKIPSFIINSSKTLKRSFLQQAFDDEGSLSKNKCGRSIQLIQYNSSKEPPERLLQMKKLLMDFGISVTGPYGPIGKKATKSRYSTYGWMIEISNQSDLWLFAQEINFYLPRKRQRLFEMLNSYSLPPRFKKGKIKEEILNVCRKLKQANNKITIKNISKELNKNEMWIAEVMRDLTKENKLVVIKEKLPANKFRSGFLPKEFDLLNL